MPKARDIPSELKEFNSIFEQLSRRHDYSRVFDDFLDLCIIFFLVDKNKKKLIKEIEKRYEKKEMDYFDQLFKCFIKTQEKMLESKKWNDALGTFYEVLASSGKKSSFGQFFTPESVVDMMVQMQGDCTGQKKKVNDPACGSGRMLISFHAHNPGNLFFAEDLDFICTKMTVINMCIHGAIGEVVNHNSLMPETFYHGWHVNTLLEKTGIPSIIKIEKEDSAIIKMWDAKKLNTESKHKLDDKNNQLSIFDEK